MARAQGRRAASTNERPPAAAAEYVVWLESQPLAERTRRPYAAVIEEAPRSRSRDGSRSSFAGWLTDHDDAGVDGPRARDLAARDYKRYLKVERGWGQASVNQALAALDHFFRFLGLGAAIVQREELPRAAPRALTVDEQRLLLRAAEESTARDRAIIGLFLFAGLRLAEAEQLRLDDVRMSARKGLVVVRSGKGDAYREVPLNGLVRRLLDEWLEVRRTIAPETEPAFFVSRTGGLRPPVATACPPRLTARPRSLTWRSSFDAR